MSRIIGQFVEALIHRNEEFMAAITSADFDRLALLSHNLKGCAGGYGFDSISSAAAAVEQEAMSAEADINTVRERVEDLISLCKAAHKD